MTKLIAKAGSILIALVGSALAFSLIMISGSASGYPDNVRYGYANCAACHVSPTGGGLLTPYGRGASEEFLSTWSNPGEGNFVYGAVATPDWLLVGGEFRGLAYRRDTKIYKSKGFIPMQAEADVGITYQGQVTGVVGTGIYDKSAQIQNAYVLGNFGEHCFARIGKFFPAFGINSPEHTLVTRRGLGFDEGQESFNVEAGAVGEIGEVIIDAILRPGTDEFSNEEKGASVRAAWYAGGSSQIGFSLLSVKGNVWQRTVPGIFVTTGFTKMVYLLAEIDQEQKRPTDSTDASTPANTRLVSAAKLGWEFIHGLHLLGSYETSIATKGAYDPRLWSAGPGLQWFPRPHLEFLAQAQWRHDETWSKTTGTLMTLMMHYNL